LGYYGHTVRFVYQQSVSMRGARLSFCFGALGFILALALMCAAAGPAFADLDALGKSIAHYNRQRCARMLSEGNSRGEQGILCMRPEVAQAFGLKVQIDPAYLEARRLFDEADGHLRRAIRLMAEKGRGPSAEEDIRRIADSALAYGEARKRAREQVTAYVSRLTPRADDRLDDAASFSLLKRLLRRSLERTASNLREALGDFFNQCLEKRPHGAPLSHANVDFVNHVFRDFTTKYPGATKGPYDLDRVRTNPGHSTDSWRRVLGRRASRYAHDLEGVFSSQERTPYPVDALLFLALIKQESNFNSQDISAVGAVGLTQIMPRTAKDLGMNHIFMPAYFEKAKSLMTRERSLRREAIRTVTRGVTSRNSLEAARRAKDLMQKSLNLRAQRTNLYARYRRELLRQGKDDRLDPGKAIRYGFVYFSQMLRLQKGDISLALASYNAGPHRVKQYGGIPPFEETVTFRNRVMKYYRQYQDRVRSLESQRRSAR
jgi:hypothetical protein